MSYGKIYFYYVFQNLRFNYVLHLSMLVFRVIMPRGPAGIYGINVSERDSLHFHGTYVSLKHWYLATSPHSAKTQMTIINIITVTKTSYLMFYISLNLLHTVISQNIYL
jgi:hypothetical protein